MCNKSLARQSGSFSIGTSKSIQVVFGEKNVAFRLIQKCKINMNYGIQTRTCCINCIFISVLWSTTVGTTKALLYKLCGDYIICFGLECRTWKETFLCVSIKAVNVHIVRWLLFVKSVFVLSFIQSSYNHHSANIRPIRH